MSSMDVGSIGAGSSSWDAAAKDAAPRPQRPEPVAPRQPVPADSGAIPDSPPPEVLDAIDAAARAWQSLRAQGRELRIAPADDDGRLIVEVRDLDGRLVDTIPPSRMLDVATTGSLD